MTAKDEDDIGVGLIDVCFDADVGGSIADSHVVVSERWFDPSFDVTPCPRRYVSFTDVEWLSHWDAAVAFLMQGWGWMLIFQLNNRSNYIIRSKDIFQQINDCLGT